MSGTCRNSKTQYFILKKHSYQKYHIRNKIIKLYTLPIYDKFWKSFSIKQRAIIDGFFGTGYVHDSTNHNKIILNPTLSSRIGLLNPPGLYACDINTLNIALSSYCIQLNDIKNCYLQLFPTDFNDYIKTLKDLLIKDYICKLIIEDIDTWGTWGKGKYPKLRLPWSTQDYIGIHKKRADLLQTFPSPVRSQGNAVKYNLNSNAIKNSMPFNIPNQKMSDEWWVTNYIKSGLKKYWKYICTYPVKAWNGAVIYYLIYATDNNSAYKIGKDIIISEKYGDANKISKEYNISKKEFTDYINKKYEENNEILIFPKEDLILIS